jgi:hypothetical protein
LEENEERVFSSAFLPASPDWLCFSSSGTMTGEGG